MEYLMKSIWVILMLLTITSGRPQNEYGNFDNNQNNNYYDRSLDYNDVDSQQNADSYDNYENPSITKPRPYNFRYSIKDDQSGTDFGQTETSDGQVIKGEYRVQLPDGRFQVVKYTADWENGYVADVSYEGDAFYPDTNVNSGGDGFQGYGNQVEEEYSQNDHDLSNSSPNDAIYRSSDDLSHVFRQDSVYDDAVSNPLPQYGSNDEGSFAGNSGNDNVDEYGRRL